MSVPVFNLQRAHRRIASDLEQRWKRILDVQAPYRWNLRRLLGTRRTLDVGCGIGRNLVNLPVGSVGVSRHEDTRRARTIARIACSSRCAITPRKVPSRTVATTPGIARTSRSSNSWSDAP